MSANPIYEIGDMPFCLGAMESPSNPSGLPNVHQFRLEVNHELARLEQAKDAGLAELLDRAYRVGMEMGTPSDSTDLGQPYVDDFMRFMNKSVQPTGNLLEIGAGTGFLTRSLIDVGWRVIAVEPGRGYSKHWIKNGVSVINDFFPSKEISGAFDTIVFYTVLEHIKDTRSFLHSVKKHLKPNGMIFLGVPDCTLEIQAGDPSILLHEHYQYFSVSSLANTLEDAGFTPVIEFSRYGRSIYAAASVSSVATESDCMDKSDLSVILEYPAKMMLSKKILNEKVVEWSSKGAVGIFCPSRVLNYLSDGPTYRFYDDAENLLGKYYPPFNSPIMSRKQLFQNPPDTLFIASRTFGSRIKKELLDQGLRSKIVTIEEIQE